MKIDSNITKSLLDRVLTGPSGETVSIASSNWFDSSDPLDAAEKELAKLRPVYEESIKRIAEVLGLPSMTGVVEGIPISEWFPEAIEARTWTIQFKTLCLALVQYDKEAPVGVILRALNHGEAKLLSTGD